MTIWCILSFLRIKRDGYKNKVEGKINYKNVEKFKAYILLLELCSWCIIIPSFHFSWKNWKRRWFVLSDRCLYYFQHTAEKLPKGVVPLENVKVRLFNLYNIHYHWKILIIHNPKWGFSGMGGFWVSHTITKGLF